jgi:hypothetical protein
VFFGVKIHQKATRFSENRIFSHKFSFFGKRNCLKTKNTKLFVFWGKGSPYLCLLATVLRFLEIMFLVKSKSA